jgi:hypothetical protein
MIYILVWLVGSLSCLGIFGCVWAAKAADRLMDFIAWAALGLLLLPVIGLILGGILWCDYSLLKH